MNSPIQLPYNQTIREAYTHGSFLLVVKPVLIFLHGGPGFKDYLKPFFLELGIKFDCIFYDQIQGPKVCVLDLITQLDGIVNRHPSKQIILVGHSWGGTLAVEYAIQYQAKIAGLVLLSAGLCREHWFDEFHQELKDLGLEDAGPNEIYLGPEDIEWGSVFLQKCWDTFSEETFASLNQNSVNNFNLIESFALLTLPIINVFGQNDIRFPARILRKYNQYNPRVRNLEISKAGHFPFLNELGKVQIHDLLLSTF